jgi:hypothetical protein
MSNRFSSYNPEIPARLISCLNNSGARYEILHEPSGFSDYGQRLAASAGLIETAVVRAGKHRVLAVIPSRHSAALERIDDGTYGLCELTGRPIPWKRLEAVPWTRFTVQAEAQLENGAHPHIGSLGAMRQPVQKLLRRRSMWNLKLCYSRHPKSLPVESGSDDQPRLFLSQSKVSLLSPRHVSLPCNPAISG